MSGEPMAYKSIKKINSRLNCSEKSIFWHQASDGSYPTHLFSRILITQALLGILILTKNNKKKKFKLLRKNVFKMCFASMLIKWLVYRKMNSQN